MSIYICTICEEQKDSDFNVIELVDNLEYCEECCKESENSATIKKNKMSNKINIFLDILNQWFKK